MHKLPRLLLQYLFFWQLSPKHSLSSSQINMAEYCTVCACFGVDECWVFLYTLQQYWKNKLHLLSQNFFVQLTWDDALRQRKVYTPAKTLMAEISETRGVEVLSVQRERERQAISNKVHRDTALLKYTHLTSHPYSYYCCQPQTHDLTHAVPYHTSECVSENVFVVCHIIQNGQKGVRYLPICCCYFWPANNCFPAVIKYAPLPHGNH